MRFDYQRPATLSEAIDLLAESTRIHRPIAYGSDLLVWAKVEAERPEVVVDLSGLEELHRLESEPSHFFIGAGVTLGDLTRSSVLKERFPALAEATATMGSVQLREGASIGGNVCTASPAGDTGPPLLCYEGSLVAASSKGEREIGADRFFTGPRQTALEPGEILVGVRLPWPREGAVGTYLKGARRAAVDLALASVAAVAWPDAEAPSGVELRLALGAVAPKPLRATDAEALARAGGLDTDPKSELGLALAAAARTSARPIDDVRSTANYRLELIGHLAALGASNLAKALRHREKESMESHQ